MMWWMLHWNDSCHMVWRAKRAQFIFKRMRNTNLEYSLLCPARLNICCNRGQTHCRSAFFLLIYVALVWGFSLIHNAVMSTKLWPVLSSLFCKQMFTGHLRTKSSSHFLLKKNPGDTSEVNSPHSVMTTLVVRRHLNWNPWQRQKVLAIPWVAQLSLL